MQFNISIKLSIFKWDVIVDNLHLFNVFSRNLNIIIPNKLPDFLSCRQIRNLIRIEIVWICKIARTCKLICLLPFSLISDSINPRYPLSNLWERGPPSGITLTSAAFHYLHIPSKSILFSIWKVTLVDLRYAIDSAVGYYSGETIDQRIYFLPTREVTVVLETEAANWVWRGPQILNHMELVLREFGEVFC